ncbi:MAG: hypothetical protein AAFY78_02730 [Cyanobacteria bacterium J06648_16]
MAIWIDRLGDTNPQFLRECRGRLKPRSVIAAVGLSVLFQVLLGLFVFELRIDLEPAEQYRVICRTLTWTIPYALFAVGGYYLVNDLTQEEKRGTLNFIRLSPRPAYQILLGKLLGVPVLPFLLVVTAMPLHLISGLLAGVSPALLLSYYLVLLFEAGFVFTLALLIGLTGNARSLMMGQQAPTAIAFAGLALFVFAPLLMLWNINTVWFTLGAEPLFERVDPVDFQWMYLSITQSSLVAHLFTLGHLALVSLLIWQGLKRQFRMPDATLVSKRLAYISVAYLNVLVWGFFQSSLFDQEDRLAGIVALYPLNVALFLTLIFGLAQSRQALIDWARYRQPGRWLDWVWGEQSPSVGAIAICYLIAAALVLPWMLIVSRGQDIPPSSLVIATISVGVCFLIYGTLVQLIFSTRVRAPLIWAVGVVATLIGVPIIVLSIFQLTPESSPQVMTIWTFLGCPFWDYTEPGIRGYALIGLGLQLAVLALLFVALDRNLRRLQPRPVPQPERLAN